MRRRFRQFVPLTALMFIIAACGDDADTSADGDAPAAEDAADSGDGTDDAGSAEEDDAEDGDDGEDAGDEPEGEGSAVVTWDGETYEYPSASCGASSSIESFQMRARGGGEDHPQLDLRFGLDGDEGDYSQPNLVAIFFDHGATIGEGEGYEARGTDVQGIDADESGASGELMLEPDNHSMAEEMNPDGGTLEFELICP